MVNKMKIFKLQLPLLSALITVLFELLVPDSSLHKSADHEYLVWFIVILTTIYEIVLLVGSRNVRGVLLYKSAFYTAFFQVLNVFNLLTVKFAVLPVLYFPSLDRIFGVLISDSAFLGQCLRYAF